MSVIKLSNDGYGMPLTVEQGVILAYVLGPWQDEVFLQLKALLAPLGIHHSYTDAAEVYNRHLASEIHTVGKHDIQKIEQKHLTLPTHMKRLAPKTSCFFHVHFVP
jgi:insertion element IS1 protein InsB